MEVVGDSFVAYRSGHWLMLGLTAVGAVALVWIGRRLRGSGGLRWLSALLGLLLAMITLADLVVGLLPGPFDVGQSLPLQLSDVLRFVAAYALWSWRRWPFALTYYWALTLDVQSLLTPNLHYRLAPWYDFGVYWSTHVLVMWAAIFLTWGVGLRPDWRAYRTAVLATIGWAATAFAANAALGTNYGFLNHKPASRSLLDVLGGWPWYLLVEFVAMIIVWMLITWPWIARPTAIRAPRRGRPASPG